MTAARTRRGTQILRTSSRSAVAIFEPYHVVEFRRGDFEDVAVLDRRHAVDGLWRDVDGFARLHLALDELVPFLDLEEHAPGPEEDRLVLLVVVLQTERVAGVHVNELADVALRLRPMQLVSPGLLHTRHVVRHAFSSQRPCSSLSGSLARNPVSTVSTSADVFERSARRATRLASAARSPRSTCLASASAVGAMLNSVRPSPTSRARSTGSAAISPQTATGTRRRRPARATSPTVRRIAGCRGSYRRDTRSSVRSTARQYWMRSLVPMLKKSASSARRS